MSETLVMEKFDEKTIIHSGEQNFKVSLEDREKSKIIKTLSILTEEVLPSYSNKDELDIIKKRRTKKKHTIAYLKYKCKPLLVKMIKQIEILRDEKNPILSARAISLSKEYFAEIWNYSPEVEPNFAEVLILLEDSICEAKWTFLNKRQFNCIIDVINIALQDNVTENDYRKSFKILYTNGVDTFPDIDYEEDEEE